MASRHSAAIEGWLLADVGGKRTRLAFLAAVRLPGSVAGDLALTLGARGGVYLAGGILPGLADALAASAFRERFLAKGRYRRYLEPIPTRLIVHPCPALPGLCAVVERP